MPTACDMRATAWRKMKEGALLPLLAGFALLFLLGSLFDAAVDVFGKWQGWITHVPLVDAGQREVGEGVLAVVIEAHDLVLVLLRCCV